MEIFAVLFYGVGTLFFVTGTVYLIARMARGN